MREGGRKICVDLVAELLRGMEREECRGMSRAEIDTRAPFRSVKEAVVIFGERVLAGEVYANKLNQIRAAEMKEEQYHATHLNSAVAELEETKQNLERAREECQTMADCLTSLKEELEKTKMELTELKAKGSKNQPPVSEIEEDIKFIENAREVEIMIESPARDGGETELQKKRSVKFANPPIQIIDPAEMHVLQRQFPVDREATQAAATAKNKRKKKKLVLLIAAMFSKKKGVSYA